MQTFFNHVEKYGTSVFHPPEWSYLKNGLDRNLKTVKDYYMSRPFAVKSNHYLVKILNNLGVSFNHNLERFYDIVDARASIISMGFKMSSSVYRGSVFKDIFYGGNISEVLVLEESYFDPEKVYRDWKNAKAVKVLMHPKSDLKLLIPNGKYIGSEDGVAVISINIAMLAVQFKAFLEYEMNRTANTNESPKTVAQFIHMFVLPNMLDSHLDIVLFNRVYNLVVGAPMGDSNKKHPFYITDYSVGIDRMYNKLVKAFKTSDKRYKTYLKSFPCTTDIDFDNLLRLPDNAPTRQIVWTHVLARLRALEMLVKLSPANGNRLNKLDNNEFLRTFKLYESDKALSHLLRSDINFDIEIAIKDIKYLIA
jgi:hypothetical protein